MNTLDKFELYLNGSLSKKEVQELEHKFRNNPELYEEFKEYSRVDLTIKSEFSSPLLDCQNDTILKRLSLKQRLSIEEDISEYLLNPDHYSPENEKKFREVLESVKNISKNRKHKKIILLNTFFKVAAVLVIIFITSVLIIENFYLPNRKLSAFQVFQKYYNPISDKSLRPFDTYQVIMQKAIIDFRNADFAAADSSLEMISKDYDTEYMYHIIKGLICLEEGKPENAKKYFNIAMNEAINNNRFVAKWYLGLTYLKENNSFNAIPLFTDLSQVHNPYKKEAKRILKTVKLK